MSIAEVVDRIELVDHHCHSITGADLDRAGLEGFLTEARSMHGVLSSFDTPIGTSVRRLCAPLLDLDPFPAPDAYVQRRVELGAQEVNRRLMRAAGVSDILVDGGYRAEELLGRDQLASVSGAGVHEVLRLERLAEDVAGRCQPIEFPEAFSAALAERAGSAKALKSIAAYRHGLDLSPAEPGESEVVEAARQWSEEAACSRRWRLTDPVLLRFVVWAGARLGHRLQIHTGLGDPDLRLYRADPALLSDFIRAVEGTGTTVMLLHCWPFHRQAAHLAAVYPHVYVDLGLALNHVGPQAESVLAETMEVVPYQKLLYSSDGFGLAELHYLGARRFRLSLGGLLEGWVKAGEMEEDYAAWVARCVGMENARHVYGL